MPLELKHIFIQRLEWFIYIIRYVSVDFILSFQIFLYLKFESIHQVNDTNRLERDSLFIVFFLNATYNIYDDIYTVYSFLSMTYVYIFIFTFSQMTKQVCVSSLILTIE